MGISGIVAVFNLPCFISQLSSQRAQAVPERDKRSAKSETYHFDKVGMTLRAM